MRAAKPEPINRKPPNRKLRGQRPFFGTGTAGGGEWWSTKLPLRRQALRAWFRGGCQTWTARAAVSLPVFLAEIRWLLLGRALQAWRSTRKAGAECPSHYQGADIFTKACIDKVVLNRNLHTLGMFLPGYLQEYLAQPTQPCLKPPAVSGGGYAWNQVQNPASIGS